MTRDIKAFLKEEDFGGLSREFWFPEVLAIANKLFADYIDQCPQFDVYAVCWAFDNLASRLKANPAREHMKEDIQMLQDMRDKVGRLSRLIGIEEIERGK